MKVICSHVWRQCIADKCHHAKPHDIDLGLGHSCQQTRCNGTQEGPNQNIKVNCVEVVE